MTVVFPRVTRDFLTVCVNVLVTTSVTWAGDGVIVRVMTLVALASMTVAGFAVKYSVSVKVCVIVLVVVYV
jgi:hypothetical protein